MCVCVCVYIYVPGVCGCYCLLLLGPPVSSEAAAKKLVLSYMCEQNRPYSAIQVFDNLHQRE